MLKLMGKKIFSILKKKICLPNLWVVKGLTHYLPVSPADNLAKCLDPDQNQQNVGPDLNPKV